MNERNTYAIIDEKGKIVEKFRTATACHQALLKFKPMERKTMTIKKLKDGEDETI